MLVYLLSCLQAEDVWYLKINDCVANTTKSNNKLWDIAGGRPDIRIIVSIVRDQQEVKKFKSKVYKNAYQINEMIQTGLQIKVGDSIQIKVEDVDIKSHDLIANFTYQIEAQDFSLGNMISLQGGCINKFECYLSPYSDFQQEMKHMRNEYVSLHEQSKKLEKENQELSQKFLNLQQEYNKLRVSNRAYLDKLKKLEDTISEDQEEE
jgi:hypothetical protein